jgi:hypothetical protein
MAVNVTRSNVTGPVTFTLSGVPGGVTATFATNPVAAMPFNSPSPTTRASRGRIKFS